MNADTLKPLGEILQTKLRALNGLFNNDDVGSRCFCHSYCIFSGAALPAFRKFLGQPSLRESQKMPAINESKHIHCVARTHFDNATTFKQI